MAYYLREEQETVLIFETATNEWRAYSTVPKHIRLIEELASGIKRLEADEEGRVIAIDAYLTEKQVRMAAPRQASPKQLEHLAKLREKSPQK